MAFALSIDALIEAMRAEGCPACRIFRQASARALESFLWENVNEPDVRQGILDAYGFCVAHTRVMVSREIFTSSVPLGTNIIYEHLGRVVAGELLALKPGRSAAAAGMRSLAQRLGLGAGNQEVLAPRGPCPACQSGENAAQNSLHVLCEELPKGGEVQQVYQSSSGLCLAHLRYAIGSHSAAFPEAVAALIDDTVTRLERQSLAMKEFIRKNNWSYRDEQRTEEEDTAWRKTLTFFTGLPGDSFGYSSEDQV